MAAPYRPPLGLPSGSVRALLTLQIMAVVIADVLWGRPPDPLWAQTVLIALAHYFTSRRSVELPPEVARRLEAEGILRREASPLYLPRHTIRVVIVLAFIGLAGYLYQAGRLWQPQALSLLGMVFAFLLGVLARTLWGWWLKGRPSRIARWWDDGKAAATLLAMGVTAAAHVLGRPDLIPPAARNATLGLALFYFGSR